MEFCSFRYEWFSNCNSITHLNLNMFNCTIIVFYLEKHGSNCLLTSYGLTKRKAYPSSLLLQFWQVGSGLEMSEAKSHYQAISFGRITSNIRNIKWVACIGSWFVICIIIMTLTIRISLHWVIVYDHEMWSLSIMVCKFN